MASSLCIGGPIRYNVVHPNISEEFILLYVVPNIRKQFNNQVCLCFGRAIQWAVFAELEGPNEVPNSIKQHVMNAYAHVEGQFEGNPVEKVPIVVTGNEGAVHLDDIPREMIGGPTAVGEGNLIDWPIKEQLLALHSQNTSLRRQVQDLQTSIENQRLEMK